MPENTMKNMKKKILVADDDQSVTKLLKTILTNEGYEVITACDGTQTINMIKERVPDLVMLDIMMPELTGYHVAFELKVLDDYDLPAHTKYIILTARGEKRDLDFGKKLGAADYITKPFDVNILLDTVKKILGED